ncbi:MULTISPECIES: Na+/H+ antiporter subunit E [unclassified Corallococcus]|uniref:Na+/H+ antiporter subunit E n=1 Tax=unclassified Corallococcus TaxID=2685029 RepID=UPI001A909702|nr:MULTISPECIES: Na+/H+ antiporter subunit E [unclassified Corallococcus]MBN9681518.1 Na+/H+ antiporter subunit E [Corallococcus sp. NCSPR001]WAS86906.1 Na+/H+ antiporter subunit E [Corallococcus sp. NCRR]
MRLHTLAHVPPLTLLYALMVGSFHPVDLALGAVLSLGVMRLFPLAGLPPVLEAREHWRRTLRLPRFGWALAVLVTRSCFQVLAVIFGPADRADHAGVVEYPMGERTARGVQVSSWVLSLAPGTVLLELDWKRRVMRVHALDASDPDKLIRQQDTFYQRYQRAVFP